IAELLAEALAACKGDLAGRCADCSLRERRARASGSGLFDVPAHGRSYLGGEASQLRFHVAFEPEDECVHAVLEGQLGELFLTGRATDVVEAPDLVRLPACFGGCLV